MGKEKELVYTLSNWMIVFLFIYYFCIIVTGGIVTVNIGLISVKRFKAEQILEYAFAVSLAISGMLCGIQYTKRLYKACITERIELVGKGVGCTGNFVYFLMRPVFSFSFSIVLVYTLLSGMFIVTGNLDYILNEKFVYLCAVLSSFLGFSIGKVMDKFETISKQNINKIV